MGKGLGTSRATAGGVPLSTTAPTLTDFTWKLSIFQTLPYMVMFTRLVRFGERGEFQPAFSESFSAPDRPDDESDSHRAAFCSASFEKGLSVALSRVFFGESPVEDNSLESERAVRCRVGASFGTNFGLQQEISKCLIILVRFKK